MGAGDISAVLAHRAAHARMSLPPELAVRLAAYYQLLSHWNRRINLTSLSDPAEAVDRLLLEPVAAAGHLPRGGELVDLGSGGGSPAIPLALAAGVGRLVMVESRVRKAAFLREALRELGLAGSVEAVRFEELVERAIFQGAFSLASVRAVRLDAAVFNTLSVLLRPQGFAALFGSTESAAPGELPPSLHLVAEHRLVPASHSALLVLQKS